MYTKANYRNDNTISIPQNYSGNAFNATPQAVNEPEKQENCAQCEINTDIPQEKKAESEGGSFIASLLPPKVSIPSGIFADIGLEELLIIGVLILLSQSHADDDILLLLFLLLFYK